MRRIMALCGALLLCLMCLPLHAVAAYRDGRMTVIDEPENFAAGSIECMRGEENIGADALTWVDGRQGKALQLSGDGIYLRLSAELARVKTLTFTAWVNWQGGESGQRLFTVARGQQNYITFSPYIDDAGISANGGRLNGLYAGWSVGGIKKHLFTPTQGENTYAMPIGEWHHVAVTVGVASMEVYIDGKLWLSQQVMTNMAEMGAFCVYIGNGDWGDPTLHALLDDVTFYNHVLSEEEIRTMAGSIDHTAYIPTEPAPTTTEPVITTTTLTTTTAAVQMTPGLWGMPYWTVYTLAGLIVAYLAVTVIANTVYRRRDDECDE